MNTNFSFRMLSSRNFSVLPHRVVLAALALLLSALLTQLVVAVQAAVVMVTNPSQSALVVLSAWALYQMPLSVFTGRAD
ncbi:MAG TPA: hypothetical protein VL091_13240 [Marinobacter sp.]|nr:hypothetical protein [Marinobacter sp.]